MNIGRKLIRLLDGAVNLAVLSVLLLLLAYGCYAIWDSGQLYAAADNARYEIYRPDNRDNRSFGELQAINPEVFGWLTVYGTGIDYPLVQGEDNEKYVNTAADGTWSLSGSLFLDYHNRKDFSDFNSIIYGHHMDKQVMFGEISEFGDQAYFDAHQYGRVYYDGTEYGVEFFAFLKIDAYDPLYRTGITDGKEQKEYLARIKENARCFRETAPPGEPHLILLSTCTSETTNGRHVLAGWVTDDVKDDPFYSEPEEKQLTGADEKYSLQERLRSLPLWADALLIVTLLFIMMFVTAVVCRKIREKRKKGGGNV